jgi:hypothetical protein
MGRGREAERQRDGEIERQRYRVAERQRGRRKGEQKERERGTETISVKSRGTEGLRDRPGPTCLTFSCAWERVIHCVSAAPV